MMERGLFTKNFLLLISGQLASLFGNFILRLALSMYVLDVTGSAAVFAGMLSAAILPTILLSPLGGILADRANRRYIMVALDILAYISVLSAALFLTEGNSTAVISLLLVILSVLGAFETPTVQACIPTMLEGENIIKGNAIVNQAASLSSLTAPVLGGVFYAALGLKPVMYASAGCFLITALFECFIKLNYTPGRGHGTVLSIVKQDFTASMRWIFKEQVIISKMLLFTALSRFFVMGITIIGLPYIVRAILGLDARYYGAAESALAIAAIAGSVIAGFLSKRFKVCTLSHLLCVLGIFVLPAGIVFLFPAAPMVKYSVTVVSFFGMQAAISIFSIYAVSLIQQETPNHFIGKVMAYTSAITLCAQPLGQMVYGILFDRFSRDTAFILIPTGLIICVIGLFSRRLFRGAANRQQI